MLHTDAATTKQNTERCVCVGEFENGK